MCYWSFVTFHLVWVKVQDLVVVAVDFLFKAVKSFAPNVNTGTHEGAKTACRFVRFVAILNPLANLAIFAGCVFIFVNGIGVALLPNILGGPGAVNAGLIATQAIAALDFPLAMAVSAIMMTTLMTLLYIGHRIFDLTKILAPIN